MSTNENSKKAYATPELIAYGNIAQITQDPKKNDIADFFKGISGEGLPWGKVAGAEDAFDAHSMS